MDEYCFHNLIERQVCSTAQNAVSSAGKGLDQAVSSIGDGVAKVGDTVNFSLWKYVKLLLKQLLK